MSDYEKSFKQSSDRIEKLVEETIMKKVDEGIVKGFKNAGNVDVEINGENITIKGDDVAKAVEQQLSKRVKDVKVSTDVEVTPEIKITKDSVNRLKSLQKEFKSIYDEGGKTMSDIGLGVNWSKDEEGSLKRIAERLKEIYALRKEADFEKKYGNEVVALMDVAAGAGYSDFVTTDGVKLLSKNVQAYFNNAKRFVEARENLDQYAKLDIHEDTDIAAHIESIVEAQKKEAESATEAAAAEGKLNEERKESSSEKAADQATDNAEAMEKEAEAAKGDAEAQSKLNEERKESSNSSASQDTQKTADAFEEEAKQARDDAIAIELRNKALADQKKILGTTHGWLVDSAGEAYDTSRTFMTESYMGRTLQHKLVPEYDEEGKPTGEYSVQYQQISKYTDIVREATKATIDLQKAENALNLEQRKATPNNANITEYNTQVKEAQGRLDEATESARKFAEETAFFYNDPQYDSKYFMSMFNEDVAEQTIRGISQANVQYNKAIESTQNKAQKAIDSVNKKLTDSQIKLDNIRATYDQKVAPGINKPVTRQSDLDELDNKRKSIVAEISRLRSSSSVSEKELQDLKVLIAEYQRLAKAKKDSNNPTKREMGGQELQGAVQREIANYDKLIAKSEEYGAATEQITQALKAQRVALKVRGDVDAYYDSQNIRKYNDALIDSKAREEDLVKTSGIDDARKKLSSLTDEISKDERLFNKFDLQVEELQYDLEKIGTNNGLGKINAQIEALTKSIRDEKKELGTTDTMAEKEINNLYSQRESIIKQIGTLQAENARHGEDGQKDVELRRQNEEKIASLSRESLSLQKQIYETEGAIESREENIVKLQEESARAVRNIYSLNEAEARDSMTSQVGKWEKQLEKLNDANKYTSQFIENVVKAQDEISRFDSSKGSIEEVSKSFKKLEDTVKDLSASSGMDKFRKAAEVSIAKLNLKIEEFIQKNPKMGREFREEFENLKLDFNTEHATDKLKEIVAELAKLEARVTAADKLGAGFFKNLRDRAMGVNAQLIAQYLSWQDIIRYLQTAASTVVELNSALTEMRKVSDESLNSLKQYQNLSFGIADSIGTTGLDLQKSTADWMRLGESMDEAAESAKAATILLNVSEFESIDDATQSLVSASQAFKELDKMEIIDVLNNIGNNFSVSTDELAQGLQNAAAVLKTQGNDLYKSVALLTAGNAITQDMSKVSAGMRTIALRIAGTDQAKDELIQMGEDVDDMIVGTHAKMQQLIKDYTAVASNAYEGIDILDANGNLRDTYDILLDISKVYQEILTEDKKAGTNRGQALVEAIAGKNRSNIAASILLNPQMLEDVYETAKDSAGSAQEELDKYLESLEGHIKSFQNATQELFHTLIDSGMLGDLIDFGTSFIKILTEIVDKLGTIPSLGLGLAVKQLILNLDKVPELPGKISEIVDGLLKAKTAVEGVGKAIEASGKAAEAVGDTAEAVGDVAEAVGDVGETAGKAAEAVGDIGEAAAGSGVSGATKLATAFKSLIPILTNPITIMAALAAATYALYKWVDGANDRQREKIAGLEDEYKSLKGDLESTNKELENVDSRIAEIQSKGTLSLVEQEELERLRVQAEMLRIAADEQERLLRAKGQELASENAKYFTQVYDGTQNATVGYTSFKSNVNPEAFANTDPLSYYGAQLQGSLEGAAKGEYNDRPDQLLQIYHTVSEANKEAIELIGKAREEYGSYEKAIASLQEKEKSATDTQRLAIQQQIADLESADTILKDSSQYIDGIGAQVDSLKTDLYQMISDAQSAGKNENGEYFKKNDIKAYYSTLKKIYELSDTSGSWNALKFGEMFDNAELELTRKELEGLAAAGKLDDETINKYPKLKAAIEGLDLIIGPNESALGMFKKEMAATAEVAEETTEKLSENAEALNTWATKRDEALAKLGLVSQERDGSLTYDESWTKYLETIKALNPELAKNQEELEKCALANLQFDKAVSDLSSNFESYKEALKDANSLTPEFSNAINALAENLTYLTGVEFSITDASKFLSDAENFNLLEQAVKGSNTALQELQARAAAGVQVNVDFNELEKLKEYTTVRVALLLDNEGFNEQIMEFSSWLNENSQFGEIDVTAAMDSFPFLKELGRIMAESSEVAMAVKKLFSELGWDVDWKMTKMKVITDQAWSGKKNDKVHVSSTYGPGGASQVNWVEKEVEVPTNIKYVPNGGSSGTRTSASKYTPKSFSPSQKSNAASGGGGNSGGSGGSGKDTSKEAEDTYEETIDFFERLIKVLDQKVDLLQAHLEDVVGSFAKNTLIDAQEDLIKQKMAGYSSAIDMYASKASEALSRVPSELQDAVQNGAVAVQDFVGEANEDVVDAINDYQGWADKVAECKQQVVELREELRKLEIQKFDNIVRDFEEINKVRQDSIDLIDKEIALFEESRDKIVGRGFYDAKIDQTQKQMNSLYEERTQLIDQANEALANGIDVASEEWFHMLDAITEVDGAIIDAEKSIEEYKNAIIQLYVDAFDREATRYANQISIREKAIAALEKQIAVTKSAGDIAGRAFYDEAIEQTEKQIAKLEDERRMLQEKMDEAVANGLEKGSDEWFSMVDSINSVDSAIQDATQSVNEYKDAIVGLYVDAFNREAERYSNAISLRQKSIDSLEKQIDVIEAAGNLAGVSLIEEQLKQTEKQIDMLQKEREELMRRMSDATANGVDVASDEWYSLVDALHEVDSSIQDCTIAVENLDNAILAIHTATFERIQNRFAGFAQELSNMAGMFDYDDVANADNTWTKEGLAQLGLQTQQYEIAKKQVAQYNEEIAELNSQYKNGKYSVTEYTERLAELKNAQWSAVQAAKSAKDNMVSLNQSRVQIVVNGINKEIEAYQKLINEQKNLLSSEKELHDYEKSLEDQNKTISNIERQLAAIEGDTSLVAAAKRAKLEDQLSSARDSLGELEYNHSIETQQAALDAQLEAYQETRNLEIEALQLSLEQEETLIAESFERVRENAILIGDEILAKAQELNITMSTELTAPWQAGENAIASYSELLTVQSSVFMQQLAAVENSEWRLQEQANSSSQAISDMFANRSDDLVLQTDIANEHTRMEEEAAWNASRAIADMFGNQADNLIYETDLAIAEMRAQEEQAWNASAAIADAFAQRADNLVATIEDARNSTENLTRTSDALADSLNNSIDGYYSGASAVGALNDIAGAAYGVADAAREASSELERMIDLQAQADAHESNTASGDIYEIDGDDVVYQGHGKVSGSGVSDTNKKSGNTYHAHGVKSATHDYLAWTQENGPEFIVSPTSGAILSPLQKGDMVLPADKTANIWEWGSFNPQEFAQKLIQSMPSTGGNVQTNTMQVGSLVQVNGNVNDSMAMMEIAAQQAANKIKQSWQQLSNQLNG